MRRLKADFAGALCAALLLGQGPAAAQDAAEQTGAEQTGEEVQGSVDYSDYMLSTGDVINVKVYNEPELSVSGVRVPANGEISYPLLGRIDITNHTVSTLEKHVTALLLNGYLKEPKVSVSVSQYRPFFIKGDVEEPGRHTFSEGMTLEQALTVAGGSTELGEGGSISIDRRGAESFEVKRVDVPIRPGDVITVKQDVASESEEAVNFVYLYGEVRKPGGYEYRKGLTVEKIVAIAGGFTPRASKRKIDISRYEEGEGPGTLDGVDLTEEVLPGDVITVGESWF